MLTTYLRLSPRDMAYFRFIVEAYDGLAVVSAVARDSETVAVRFSAGCAADVQCLLRELAGEIDLTVLTDPKQEPAAGFSIEECPDYA
jgi:hypothetical protein